MLLSLSAVLHFVIYPLVFNFSDQKNNTVIIVVSEEIMFDLHSNLKGQEMMPLALLIKWLGVLRSGK